MATATQTKTVAKPPVSPPTAKKGPANAAPRQSTPTGRPIAPVAPVEPAIEEVENETRGKRGAKPKPEHPTIAALAVDAEGKYTQTISELPADFDYATHRSIPRGAWSEDHLFFEYRANHLQHMADAMRVKAEQYKTLGGPATSKVKGLAKLQEKMAKLEELLASQGIDVKTVLAQLQKKSTPAT